MMKINPQTPEAYQLLHDGSLALADAEEYGFTVDVDYCHQVQKEIAEEKADLEEAFWYTELGKGWKTWAKRNHVRPSLGSDQLADVLKFMGTAASKKTKTGKVSTDEESLNEIELDGIATLIRMRKMDKASGTYINQLLNEVVDGGIIHPMFSLNIPVSYRSSCSNPSIQNFPIRDPWMGKVIRQAIIPRTSKRRLVEADFSGLEVRVAACYNKDPVLMKYLADKSMDMHRDMAMECFLLEEDEVHKWARHAAKNMFVFPQFYGSFHEECAKNLWKRSPSIYMKGDEEYSIREYLRDQGFNKLGLPDRHSNFPRGSFAQHIKEVEDRFWNDRFKVYTAWKKKHYADYLKNGYVDSFTGFRYSGEMKRTEVINYPIQGAAFHCNLWSFIQVNNTLKHYNMKSKLIGQIHDSIIGDVTETETQDFYDIVQEVTQELLAKEWDWINVDMEIEIEAAPLGASWYEKEEVKLVA